MSIRDDLELALTNGDIHSAIAAYNKMFGKHIILKIPEVVPTNDAGKFQRSTVAIPPVIGSEDDVTHRPKIPSRQSEIRLHAKKQNLFDPNEFRNVKEG